MENKFKKMLLISIIVLCGISCAKVKFQEKDLNNVKVYFNNADGRLSVPDQVSLIQNPQSITIPIEVVLSGPAPAIFTLGLSANPDTINKLINTNKLGNAVAATDSTYSLQQNIEIPFGVNKMTFNLNIASSAIEQYYGKILAIGVNINSITKGNSIDLSRKTLIILINTTSLLQPTDLHYISFANTGAILTIPGLAVTNDNTYVTIPLSVALSGSVGKMLTVGISANTDTVTQLITRNLIQNAVLLNNAVDYTVPANASVGLNQSTGTVNALVNVNSLLKNYNKISVFALTLGNPSIYRIDQNSKTLVFAINSFTFLNNITGLLKNTTRPFTATSKEAAGRWGVLDGWISNTAVLNHTGFGSYDNNNSTNIAMESGYNGAPSITNGKIYQTLILPAGKYRFQVTVRAANTPVFYIAVAPGTTLPDANNISASTTLAFTGVTTTSGAIYTDSFQLTQSTQVTLGFCGSLSGSQSINIQDVKLFHDQ